jgi:hypothetical protein
MQNAKTLPPRFGVIVTVVGFAITLIADQSPAAEPGAPWLRHVIDDAGRGADGVKLRDVNGDGRLDITTGWEESGETRVYLHPRRDKVTGKWPAVTVGKTRSVEDAVFTDLDADGAPDVVASCEGKERALFVHWGPRKEKLLDKASWQQAAIPVSQNRMMWMFAIEAELDGKEGVEVVAAGKGKGAEIGWMEIPRGSRDVSAYRWHPISPVGWTMSLVALDMDGDGDRDVLVSDRKGSLRACRWLENPGPGPQLRESWKNHFIGGRDAEVMFLTVTDLDGDGLDDVLAAAKPARILVFRRKNKQGDGWERSEIPYADNMGSGKGIAAGDLDGDGRTDLIISCEHANPPKSGVTWLSCSGNPLEDPWQRHEISGPDGIKFDRIELSDIDADGDLDVLTCEERHAGKGIGVFWYENRLRENN